MYRHLRYLNDVLPISTCAITISQSDGARAAAQEPTQRAPEFARRRLDIEIAQRRSTALAAPEWPEAEHQLVQRRREKQKPRASKWRGAVDRDRHRFGAQPTRPAVCRAPDRVQYGDQHRGLETGRAHA